MQYPGEWGNSGDGDSGADNGLDESVDYAMDFADEPSAQDDADEAEYEREQLIFAVDPAGGDDARVVIVSVGEVATTWTPPTAEQFRERMRRINTAVRLRTGRTRPRNVQKISERNGMDTLALAQRNLERAQREMARAEEIAARNGTEPPVGSVVAFVKHYAAGPSTEYSFAAIRTELGWYVTGRETGVMSWDGLNEFADEDTLYVVTGWDSDRSLAVAHPVMAKSEQSAEAGSIDLPLTGAHYRVRGSGDEVAVIEEVYVMGDLVRTSTVTTFAGDEGASREASELADTLNERHQGKTIIPV